MADKNEPVITEPLPDWVKRIVELAVAEHTKNCPVAPRVTKLELRFATLLGYMIGCGSIGGTAGALLIKFLGA